MIVRTNGATIELRTFGLGSAVAPAESSQTNECRSKTTPNTKANMRSSPLASRPEDTPPASSATSAMISPAGIPQESPTCIGDICCFISHLVPPAGLPSRRYRHCLTFVATAEAI